MRSSNEFARRIAGLAPEGAYAVLAQAQALEAQGRDIIHLEIGEPDFQTPAHISLAGIRGIADGQTRYNPSAGIQGLRAALARDAGERRKVSFAPDQVTVAPGAKPILLLSLLALIEPGDEVISPDPGFPAYDVAIGLAGGAPVHVPFDETRGFDLDLKAFDRAVGPRSRMIILNSPGNPTGGVLSAETLDHVARAACRHNCWVLSDEIYSRLVYEEPTSSIVTRPGMAERTIIVDGFSKTYSMTGWRLGYGIMPEPMAGQMGLLLTHSVGCTSTFTQAAGLEAVLGPQDRVEIMRSRFRERRDVMVRGLNEIAGFSCPTPRGAFYAFPNVEAAGGDVNGLATYLLEEAGVALLPGTSFGPGGKGHLRLSYATSVENIEKALTRIADAMKRR